jgi:hypothetical protein
VQILDGEVRKCFIGLPTGSIADIDVFYENFLRQWGDKKYYLYYITEFGSLKRKNGESVPYLTKIFNNMYNKIPTEIKSTKTSANITFFLCI